MCYLYYYDHKWNVGTAETPDASELLPDGSKSIEKYFWELWDNMHYKLPTQEQYCYVFEILSPKLKTICKYSEQLVLIAARNMLSLRESSPTQIAAEHNWISVAELPSSFSSIDQVNYCYCYDD
jgi:hypothetical protein